VHFIFYSNVISITENYFYLVLPNVCVGRIKFKISEVHIKVFLCLKIKPLLLIIKITHKNTVGDTITNKYHLMNATYKTKTTSLFFCSYRLQMKMPPFHEKIQRSLAQVKSRADRVSHSEMLSPIPLLRV